MTSKQKIWGHSVKEKTYKSGSGQYRYYTEMTVDGRDNGNLSELYAGAYGSTKKESRHEALKIFTIRVAQRQLDTDSHAELMGYKNV